LIPLSLSLTQLSATRFSPCCRIAKRSGTTILEAGGVIRGLTNWGTFLLPKPKRKKDQGTFHRGHYFVMRFDSSSKAQHSMRRNLGNDPRLLRYSVVRMSGAGEGTRVGGRLESLDDLAGVEGRAGWGGFSGSQVYECVRAASEAAGGVRSVGGGVGVGSVGAGGAASGAGQTSTATGGSRILAGLADWGRLARGASSGEAAGVSAGSASWPMDSRVEETDLPSGPSSGSSSTLSTPSTTPSSSSS